MCPRFRSAVFSVTAAFVLAACWKDGARDAGPRPLEWGVIACAASADGLTTCDDGGSRNRAVAVACPALPPPPEPGRGAGCQTHADCDAGTFCVGVDGYVVGGEGEGETACRAPCTTDDDCADDQVCLCAHHGTFNTCIDAECRTPADCDEAPCVLSEPSACSPALRFSCRGDDNACSPSRCSLCVSYGDGGWAPRVGGDCD